jgi:hypothetical protein
MALTPLLDNHRSGARSATVRLALIAFGLALAVQSISGGELAWTPGPGYRSAALPVPATGRAGFTLMDPASTGILFTNVLSKAKAAENQIRLNGSGVACGDIDGDGWCDLYFCGLENGNKLYRNLGNWKFADITEEAGVACAGQYSSGAVFADVNGDGLLDLLVNGIGTGTRMFLNDGHGHFSEMTGSGLSRKYAATSFALADIDGDGALDLYVPNYRTTTIRSTGLPLLRVNGKLQLRPEDREDYELTPEGLILESGEPHFLYRNDGRGNFQALSWTNGAFLDEAAKPLKKVPKDWGLFAAFRDLNGDGAPDLYVCGDFQSPDRVWINDGRGQFRELASTALRNTSTFSMAVDFADINRDGWDDWINLDMMDREHVRRVVQFSPMIPIAPGLAGILDRPQFNRNTLQVNRGDGTWAETAYYSGLEASGWTWSAIFLDVDLDGYEDVLTSTGHEFDTQDLDATEKIEAMGPLGRERMASKVLMYPALQLPRYAFRNLGNLRFQECGAAWGFNDIGVTHGMALADLDNDGVPEVIVNSLNAPARIYRNLSAAPRIAVRLNGLPPNTRGIGARIVVRGGAVPSQSQEMMCGGRYLSGDDNCRVFAAGAITNRLDLEVLWRSGRRTLLTNLPANRVYEIQEEPSSPIVGRQTPPAPAPWFEDASGLLHHTHADEPFDDFQRQKLLPNRLSQLGPGVAWADLEGRGRDDLLIGSGKGGSLALYRNDGRGGFRPDTQPPWGGPADRDQCGIVGVPGWGALVASANYEDGRTNGGALVLYRAGQREAASLVPAWDSSAGAVALADYGGKGELGVFIGARVRAGQYPLPGTSRLYRADPNRKLALDDVNTAALERAGLVSGAVWSDLDGDGFPELILACDWGPIRIFHNHHGALSERDEPLSWSDPLAPGAQAATQLSQLTGWWTGVAAADLDGDGWMDIIAANWGLNTKYRASLEHPRKIYYGDFQGTGSADLIEAYFDTDLGKEVPEREFDAVAEAMPFLRGIFRTHRAYGTAGSVDVLGPRLTQTRVATATMLASVALLNRTNGWLAVPLPVEAQLAPSFAVAVGDFDGDGAEDVFLSQNFFATQIQTTRADAGRGLWLRGDGQGGLRPVPGQESGVKVYGEQRGAAVGDYDGDGRPDLVVSQNSANTMLFHNVRGKQGLRVRLTGPPGNPAGFGAVIRLRFGERWGPAREVHGGSGYWSQDSAIQVMATPATPSAVWVRWPGGKTAEMPVPAGAREMAIPFEPPK